MAMTLQAADSIWAFQEQKIGKMSEAVERLPCQPWPQSLRPLHYLL